MIEQLCPGIWPSLYFTSAVKSAQLANLGRVASVWSANVTFGQPDSVLPLNVAGKYNLEPFLDFIV